MAKKKTPPKTEGPLPGEGRLVLSRLDQVRAIAIRLRMLMLFGEEPRTTKQVAELLGEKPTRLYHHVDAMLRAGLIHLERTRQNRGATEKYYRAAAQRFDVGDEVLAHGPSPREGETARMVREIANRTRDEVLAHLHRESDASTEAREDPAPPLIARAIIRATPDELREIRAELERFLERRQRGHAKESDGAGRRTYALSLFFYPQ